MALNLQPLPSGWIKEGMVVRCMAPIGLMRVRHVHDDGDVDAARARSSKMDIFKGESKRFTPASIEDYITFHLDTVKVGNCFTPQPYEDDEREFSIRFRDKLVTADIDKLKTVFEAINSSANPIIVVTVPQSWLDELVIVDPVTPAVLARAQAETDLIVKQSADAYVKSVNEAARESDAAFAEAMDTSPVVHLASEDPNVQKATDKFVKVASGGKYKNTDELLQESKPRQRPAKVEADSAVVDWFTRMFTKHGVDMAGVKIAPTHRLGRAMGQDPTYTLIWPNTQAFGANIKLVSAAAKELRLRDFFANDRHIIVDLPAEWTPTHGEVAAAPIEAAADEPSPVEPVEPADADLAETARRITELQERNARLHAELEEKTRLADETIADLQAQVDSLVAAAKARDLRAQDASEAYEAADPAPAQSLTTCKEVKTLHNVLDADLQKQVNDHWEVQHYHFDDQQNLHVVLFRFVPAPTAHTVNAANARLIEKISPAISYRIPQPDVVGATVSAVRQAQTPAINFGADIASARKQLADRMYDPNLSYADFEQAVSASHLPKEDKDAYLREFQHMRSGPRRDDLRVRSPFANRPDVVIANPVAGYQLPPRQEPPIGMTADERVEFRMDQLRGSARQYVEQRVGGQS